MNQESLMIDGDEYQLHVRHIWKQVGGKPVFMLHGAIENGLIFYTTKGKGLACYLADLGFDVYVADLRGRGRSEPKIDANAHYGQHEAITQDIPRFLSFIQQQNNQPIHLVSHSWGGVLMASAMARFPELLLTIASNLCFGTKRSISVKSIERFLKVNLYWNYVALQMAKRKGYLDAKKHGAGSDNETLSSLQHSVAWVKKGPWVDPSDGFNYFDASKQIKWPPSWHLTGVKDKVLGNEKDVKRFIEESHNSGAKFTLLSKRYGNHIDYDHIDILTHPKAVYDHFPKVAQWMLSIDDSGNR